MAIAIYTKYLNPTDTKAARIKASARYENAIVSVIVPYAHESSEPHLYAAIALRDKYWPAQRLYDVGYTLDGKGNIYSINPDTILGA